MIPDEFQARAMDVVDGGGDLLLTAHTGSGKTLVTDYAIWRARQRGKRALYVCPNKALCNQRFYMGGVGIHTGERRCLTESCTAVTLEILCFAKELSADTDCVIFDEAHCYSNNERGALFDAALASLPTAVQLILVSASWGGTSADTVIAWMKRVRGREMTHVTNHARVVPLSFGLHFGKGMLRALDDRTYTPNRANRASFYSELVTEMRDGDRLPAIIFFFSIKKCEEERDELFERGVDLLTSSERAAVESALAESPFPFTSAGIERQAESLRRGFGTHHSGVAPFVRLLTERLVREGVLKLVFATETLAVGVNLPIKTVVLDSLEKMAGCMRMLTGSELMQMAGRAGRRGKDDRGHVIVTCRRRAWTVDDVRSVMESGPAEVSFPSDPAFLGLFCANRGLDPVAFSGRLHSRGLAVPTSAVHADMLASDGGLSTLGTLALNYGLPVARAVSDATVTALDPVDRAVVLSAFVGPWRPPDHRLGEIVAALADTHGGVRFAPWSGRVAHCMLKWLRGAADVAEALCGEDVMEGTFVNVVKATASLCLAAGNASGNAQGPDFRLHELEWPATTGSLPVF